MSKLPLVLFGAGGHARACIDVIEEQDRYKVVGLIGLQEEVGKTVDGYEVIASEQNLSEISRYAPYALVAVGQIKSAHKRINLYKNAIESGFELAIVISPHAYVSSRAQVGFGTIVMHGAVINSNAKVGTNCIVNH
jgi:FlaA1/EpsC-like NDP-sugar epimerase